MVFGKASVSLDPENGLAYFIESRELKVVDLAGRTRTLAFEESGKALSSLMLTMPLNVADDYVERAKRPVRVPVVRAHSISVNAEFERPVSVEAAKAAITAFEGAELVDDPANRVYPTPLDFSRKVKCGVGRIRLDTAFAGVGIPVTRPTIGLASCASLRWIG